MMSSSLLFYSGENFTGLQILYIKFVGYDYKVLHHRQVFNCLCTNNILYLHTRFHMHISLVHYLLPSDVKKRLFFHYYSVILTLLEYYCNRNCYFFKICCHTSILETQSERCWCWSCLTSSHICKSDMIIPSFMNIHQLVQKVVGGAYARTTWWSHRPTFSHLLRKESGLKRKEEYHYIWLLVKTHSSSKTEGSHSCWQSKVPCFLCYRVWHLGCVQKTSYLEVT